MDIHSIIRYSMGHATPWNPSTVRNPKTSGHVLAEGWQDLSVGGCNPERLDKLRGALGPGLSQRRRGRTPTQASAGPSSASVPVSETQAAAPAGARCRGGGIFDAALDSPANCQSNREAFRDCLSPWPRVAGDDGPEMDVAEAGAPRHAEGRGGHRTLEEASVAPDKKKPEDLGPTSHSSMKAASSSYRTSARLGLRWAKPRSSGIAINATAFPQSLPLPYPHRASDWGFTSVSTPPILPEWRSSDSCATFCVTCADRLCCSGMAAPFTDASSSRSSFIRINGSIRIGSQHTLRRSIRMNSFGLKPRTPWPMGAPRTWTSSVDNFTALCIVSETHSDFFGPAFMLQNCRGHNSGYIH